MSKKRENNTLLLPFGNPEEQKPAIERTLTDGGFQVRPKQVAMIDALCNEDRPVVFVADTGDGKSVVYIVRALVGLPVDQTALLLTTQQHLVVQFSEEARRFPELSGERVLGVSGRQSPIKRAKLYATPRRLIVATRQAVLNDVQRGTFPTERIGLVGFDEIHHAQGNDTYVKLFPIVAGWDARRIGMTASPGKNEGALAKLGYEFGAERVLVLPREARRIKEEVREVSLHGDLALHYEILRGESLRVWGALRSKLNINGALFDLSPPDPRKPPSFAERQIARQTLQQIYDRDKELAKELHGLWAEHGLLDWLSIALGCSGTFALVDDFAYRHAWSRIKPRVTIAELESEKRVLPRFFERRVLNNRRVWTVFAENAVGTLYWNLVRTNSGTRPRTWSDVWKSAFPEESSGSMTSTEIAREFFQRALVDYAKRGPDHPSAFLLESVFEEYQHALDTHCIVVFTQTRRHAQFLSEYCNRQFEHLGVKAGWAAGTRIGSARRLRIANLDAFNTHDLNVLIGTSFIREGIDTKRAIVGVNYVVSDTNPIAALQGRGRIDRERHAVLQARFIQFVTRGTPAETRPLIAKARERKMHRALFKRAKLVYPEESQVSLLEGE